MCMSSYVAAHSSTLYVLLCVLLTDAFLESLVPNATTVTGSRLLPRLILTVMPSGLFNCIIHIIQSGSSRIIIQQSDKQM
jgi:hypothetical protein